VAITRANLVAYVQAIEKIAMIPPGSKCTQLFELSFDLSVHDIFRTWIGGGSLYIMEDEETLDPVGFARRHGLECWFSVPSVVSLAKRLKRLENGSLPDFRLSLFCGEALPTSIAAEWSRAAPNSRILNLYGPTEATIAITAHEYRQNAYGELSTVPLGAAFPQSAAVALSDAEDVVQAGEVGELWLGGAQIAKGYINNEAETAERFVSRRIDGYAYDRWYRTGDSVRLDPEHGLIFLGRRDQQVKVGGYIESSCSRLRRRCDLHPVARMRRQSPGRFRRTGQPKAWLASYVVRRALKARSCRRAGLVCRAIWSQSESFRSRASLSIQMEKWIERRYKRNIYNSLRREFGHIYISAPRRPLFPGYPSSIHAEGSAPGNTGARRSMIRAGLPITMAPGGTDLVTNDPAATIAPSPIVTPCKTMARAPSQTSLPITTSFSSINCSVTGLPSLNR
jgi:hypothetical protein